MDRLACVELAAFPLQLLVGAHEDWRGEPAAVVERDAPHGILSWVNASARQAGVLPGQRYAAALALCSRLRAGVITQDEVTRGVEAVLAELQHFSPKVEPAADEPGVFWINARGLRHLFGTPRAWAHAIHARLSQKGFEARIAVGFRRFTTYAAAKALEGPSVVVFDDLAREQRVAAAVSLARLSIDPAARDALAKLAILSVGDFARLPAGGILRRFGAGVHRLQRLAAGALDEALTPASEHIPLAAHVDLEQPEVSIEAVVAWVAELARPLCATLAANGEATSAIALRLDLDDHTALEERVLPARPSADPDWLVRLVRMRLEGRALASGAVRIEVTLSRTPVCGTQSGLFQNARQRAPAAAAKAFSALRAAHGELAVVRARPASAHLPEKSFVWERCDALAPAAPRVVSLPPLVRCLFETPLALPPRGRRDPDGWLLRGVTHGSVARLFGPYRLSGGWWRSEVRREYYFAELTGGEIAWIFYDQNRRRWFLQGAVS